MLEHLEKKLTVGKYVKQQAEVNLNTSMELDRSSGSTGPLVGKKDIITSNDLKIRR